MKGRKEKLIVTQHLVMEIGGLSETAQGGESRVVGDGAKYERQAVSDKRVYANARRVWESKEQTKRGSR